MPIELAEEGSLYTLIYEKHYHPKLEESLRWAKEIAEGMNYLHQEKIIHRDLKSRNVLCCKTLKICDFGTAKEFEHTTMQTGTGTYRWIAPEVLKGEKVSLSCDVFSYGMVLFEIFKQELPFTGVNDVKVISMVSEGKTPAIPASLKPYLANLMKSCWLMNPKGRPSFQEILIILEKKECLEPVSNQKISGATETTVNERPSTEDRPTLQQLQVLRWSEEGGRKEMRVMRTIAPRWRDVGIAFGLDFSDLNSIETSCLKDVKRCTEQVVTTWLEKGRGCTWKGLMEALEDAEFSDLADRLKNALHVSTF